MRSVPRKTEAYITCSISGLVVYEKQPTSDTIRLPKPYSNSNYRSLH